MLVQPNTHSLYPALCIGAKQGVGNRMGMEIGNRKCEREFAQKAAWAETRRLLFTMTWASWRSCLQTKEHNNGLQVSPTIWSCATAVNNLWSVSKMGTHAHFLLITVPWCTPVSVAYDTSL